MDPQKVVLLHFMEFEIIKLLKKEEIRAGMAKGVNLSQSYIFSEERDLKEVQTALKDFSNKKIENVVNK